MAQIFPQGESDDRGERKVLKALKEQLSDRWLVFRNVAWLGMDVTEERYRAHEADFLIAKRDFGILLLEVKGGPLKIDKRTNQYYRYSPNGKREPATKSFWQAKKNMYDLSDWMKRQPKSIWPSGHITGHAVSFPDATVAGDVAMTNANQDLTIDRVDLTDIEPKLTEVRDESTGGGPDEFTKKRHMEGLIQLFAQPRMVVNTSNRAGRDKDEQEMLLLEKEQYGRLIEMSEHRRAKISGSAGTGKTVLAFEKARQLKEKHKRVLFVCYNVRIAEELKKRSVERWKSPEKRFDVLTYHQLCTSLTGLEQLDKNATIKENHQYYRRDLPQALIEAGKKLGPQYEAIVVDGYEDFEEIYWKSLLGILNPAGILYMFGDDHQKVLTGNKPVKLPDFTGSIRLYKNIRNSEPVFKLVEKLYGGREKELLECLRREDVPECNVWTYSNEDQMLNKVEEAIVFYKNTEEMDLKDIKVITPRYTSEKSDFPGPRSNLGNIKKNGHHKLVKSREEKNDVEFESIFRHKGLESKVVIICEVDNEIPEEDMRTRLYTAISRATSHVTVLKKDTLWPGICEDLESS